MKRYRLQRRLIGRVYSAANVAKYEDALTAALERIVQRLNELEGKEIDLKEWMHIITVECLGATVLSWSPGLLRDGTDWGTLSHSFQGWRRKCLFGVFPTMKKMEQLSPSLGRAFASLWAVTYRPPPTFKPFFPVSTFSECLARRPSLVEKLTEGLSGRGEEHSSPSDSVS